MRMIIMARVLVASGVIILTTGRLCGQQPTAATTNSAIVAANAVCRLLQADPGNPALMGQLKQLLGKVQDADALAYFTAVYTLGSYAGGNATEGTRSKSFFNSRFPSSPYASALALENYSATCSTCSGAGSKDANCPQCGGSKRCASCGGKGSLTAVVGTRPCQACGGSGDCKNCKRTGKIQQRCAACGGQGAILSKDKVQATYMELLRAEKPMDPAAGILLAERKTALEKIEREGTARDGEAYVQALNQEIEKTASSDPEYAARLKELVQQAGDIVNRKTGVAEEAAAPAKKASSENPSSLDGPVDGISEAWWNDLTTMERLLKETRAQKRKGQAKRIGVNQINDDDDENVARMTRQIAKLKSTADEEKKIVEAEKAKLNEKGSSPRFLDR